MSQPPESTIAYRMGGMLTFEHDSAGIDIGRWQLMAWELWLIFAILLAVFTLIGWGVNRGEPADK